MAHAKKNRREGEIQRILKSKAAELYDPAWGDSSTERCSCHSPSKHPIAQANDLAPGDAFLPWRQRPAKVAPRRDYPTRAGHGHRLQLSAAREEGCLPLAQGKRAAAALRSHGTSGGLLSSPGAVHAGDEGKHLLFAMCCRGFVMGHGDCGPCRL